jgi:hypothetical protein
VLPPAADRKLALVVRHGQAISNYLSDTLGPDKWYQVEGTCKYDDNGTVWHLFDAGEAAAVCLSVVSAGTCVGTEMGGQRVTPV